MDETVGKRLRRLRRAAGLSQRQLATDGVSYAYISRIEAGTRTPSVKALRKIAPKLGVDVEYLETGEPRLVVEGPLGDELIDDLLNAACERGVKARQRVRIVLEDAR